VSDIPSKDKLIEQYKEEFASTVEDGKQLLKDKADIVAPIFEDWAEGHLALLSSDDGQRAYGRQMIESAQRNLEDLYASTKAAMGNLLMDKLVNGLQSVLSKLIVPIILGSIK